MKSFNPKSKQPERAVQAWQILVGMAMNRQTTTYTKLSIFMYKKKCPGVLNKVLGHIAFFCISNKLPPLTSIVVGTSRGTPGKGLPVDPKTIDSQREDVYCFDWYNIYPPSAKELKDSYPKKP